MSSHTPGPWIARNWTCHAPTTVMRQSGSDNPKTWPEVVAECSGIGELHDNAAACANARLIAAAPDLLAALIEAHSWLTAYNIGSAPVLKLIQSAIDKATGVSHA